MSSAIINAGNFSFLNYQLFIIFHFFYLSYFTYPNGIDVLYANYPTCIATYFN